MPSSTPLLWLRWQRAEQVAREERRRLGVLRDAWSTCRREEANTPKGDLVLMFCAQQETTRAADRMDCQREIVQSANERADAARRAYMGAA